MQKTLGPFAQKVLRPPAGTPRRPTCSLHWFLPVRIALRLKKPRFFNGFGGGPRGPWEGPKRSARGFPSATLPKGPQEAPKRPPRGPHGVAQRPPRGPREANQSNKQPLTHSINESISQSFNQPNDPSINHPLNQSTHQPVSPGPAECAKRLNNLRDTSAETKISSKS